MTVGQVRLVRSSALLAVGVLFAWSLMAARATRTEPVPTATTSSSTLALVVSGAAALDEACRRQQGARSSAVYYAGSWRCVAPEGEIWDADLLAADHACGARHADGASLMSDETGVRCREGS